MAIPVKLPVFEGPLDLLMHLIEKNKIDIYDIPIVEITDQYLEYVHQMDHEDMDVTSEFLVMAATLLDIKSRMLLPREKDEETGEEEADPREELVQRLLEYKMYKYLSEELAVRREEAGVRYFRAPSLPKEVRNYQPPIDYADLLSGTDLRRLEKVFGEVLRRKKSRRDPIRSGFGKIKREQVSMDTKSLYIRAYLQEHPRTDFRALLESQESREEVIVTFLILLELMKTQKVHIVQDSIGGSILVEASGPQEGTESREAPEETEFPEDPEQTEFPEAQEETDSQETPEETDSQETPEQAEFPEAPEEADSPETPDTGAIEETIEPNLKESRNSLPLTASRNVEVTAPMRDPEPEPAPPQEPEIPAAAPPQAPEISEPVEIDSAVEINSSVKPASTTEIDSTEEADSDAEPTPPTDIESDEPAKDGSAAEKQHFSARLWYGRLPLYGTDPLRRERASHWELERLSRLWARRRF